ncbi:MAG TPA: hypothetical protein VFY73_01235 [Ideonella sp.]|uniref:hypothetical protein n=1 Tax=Ideonella sp. TaxID=1929293 RepID=UPI002E2EB77F|nr:hypothetical protein [Ideonella sp.]HEX5682630.1 hypothetical protein [Ideonella sp.]
MNAVVKLGCRIRIRIGIQWAVAGWLLTLGTVSAANEAEALGTGSNQEPDGACASFYADDFALVKGKVTKPFQPSAKPARGTAVRESAFGTCTVRSTDHRADGINGFTRNDYSRRQAFNTDNTRQLVYALDGHWHLYDAKTYQHIKVLNGPAGDAEPQWSAKSPSQLFYLPTNGRGMKVYKLDVTTNQTVTVGDLASRLKARWPAAQGAWTRSEGSPSADGRFWCFLVDDANFEGLGLVTWDKNTDTITGMMDLHGDRPDHVSMSPTGRYCVASWYGGPGVIAYKRDFSSSKTIARIGEHSDIGLDANGEDQFVSVDYGSDRGAVFMVNLRTGARVNLFPTYLDGTATALHISAKSFRKPGWFVMSTYAEYGDSQQWLHRKISVVQMAANPKIYNIAHTHVKSNGYWTEPMASVNRDLTKIVWTSNWDLDTDTDVDTYMVQIPSTSIP